MVSPKVTIVVERSFDQPRDLAELQAQEDAHAWCLSTNKVKFIKTYFSTDRKRMLCIYEAPDAEAVRRAQTDAGMPFTSIYAATEHLAP